MNWTEALTRLQRMVAYDVEPTLSSAEVLDLLKDAQRADEDGNSFDSAPMWKAAYAYVVGDLVTPTTRNGHLYRVTATDGSSGTTEPVWPTTDDATVTADGVTYQEYGATSWAPTWDLNYAAMNGWEWKANKATNTNQFIQDSRGTASDYTYLNCRRQAEEYRKKIQVSVPVRGRNRSWMASQNPL